MQTALVSLIDFQFLSRMLSHCVRIVGIVKKENVPGRISLVRL